MENRRTRVFLRLTITPFDWTQSWLGICMVSFLCARRRAPVMTKINRILVLISTICFGLLLFVSQSEAVTTKKLFLGPDDFKVDSPTFQFINGGGTLESLSGQITFHARLNLPKGAVMKSVIFYGNDTFGGKVCVMV